MQDKQWQELCEWAGFTLVWIDGVGTKYYQREDDTSWVNEPPQDMNTLFRWMWPKLTEVQRWDVLFGVSVAGQPYLARRLQREQYLDVFEALAQTIYKVMKDE